VVVLGVSSADLLVVLLADVSAALLVVSSVDVLAISSEDLLVGLSANASVALLVV
jgi:hypothetical protein